MPLINERDQVLRYPTPVFGDMMFYEKRDSTLPKNQNPVLGSAHPNSEKYPDHKLCHVEAAGPGEAGLQIWHYIVDRARQDEYNWEHSTCSIGGRKFAAIVRTYITPRTEYDPDSPALGSAMPELGEVDPEDHSTSTVNGLGVEVALFGSGYVLAEREQSRTDANQIDNLYVVERRVYVKKVTMEALGFDEAFGGVLPSSVTLYHKAEVVTGGSTMSTLAGLPANAYWGLQADGTVRTWEQLSDEWYAVKTQTVVPGTFADGVVTLENYSTNQDYYWPPVLNSITFMNWQRRDGGLDIYPYVDMAKEGYRGPCKAQVLVRWASTAFTINKVPQMLPTSIYYASPFFRINVPACLHGAVTLFCDIGSTDPTYTSNVGSSQTEPATNYTSWDQADTGTGFTAYDEQKPFRGGYLRTTITVFKPA
jgi:hypothetical protein